VGHGDLRKQLLRFRLADPLVTLRETPQRFLPPLWADIEVGDLQGDQQAAHEPVALAEGESRRHALSTHLSIAV